MPSQDIQVFVQWKDQTIFAGEDVECTITFRNVAESNESDASGHPQHGGPQRKQSRANNGESSSFFSLKSPLFGGSRRSSSLSPNKKSTHRTSASLSTSHSFPPPSTPRVGPQPGHSHKRSVSILSIDSEGGSAAGGPVAGPGGNGVGAGVGDKASSPFSRRPPKGHGRSASLQVLPRRNESYDETFTKGVCCLSYPDQLERMNSVVLVVLVIS